MAATIPKSALDFLYKLAKNNQRPWMETHKCEYQLNEQALKKFYAEIKNGLTKTDEISKVKIFRIHRDVRFSKDKTPYNVHRSASFSRAGAHRRGSYYVRIEPHNKSRIAGGFFAPEASDLFRIRKEFQLDASSINAIFSKPEFNDVFGGAFLSRDAVKTAPKGFSKEDPNIQCIRLKSFVVGHSYTDAEVLAPNFTETVIAHFELLRPFLDYMSEVLTTDLNGERIHP